jgi:EmrB/QacA subfamily drug resistance transporter
MDSDLEKKPNKWNILSVMIITFSMIFIDSTVLPVTLPTIQRELGISDLGLQWLINAYLLSLTVLLILGGKLSDILGARKVCIFGLIIFALSSACCGFSNSEGWFVTSRAFQGLGAALLLPATGAILLAAFPAHERGRAMGIYLGAGSIFLSLGPPLGGFITQYLNWRYVFWINIPVACISLFSLFLFVPRSREHKGTFDLPGFLTLVIGISAFVIGLMETPRWGWDSYLTLTFLFLGIALIALLIKIDRRTEHPFIDFSLFKSKSFTASVTCVFLAQFLMMVTVFWAIFFQHILKYSPSVAGMITLVANSPVIFMAPIAGYMTDRFGPKIPATLGFSLIFIGLISFINVVEKDNWYLLFPTLIIYGAGMPLVLNPCFVTAMNKLPTEKWGVGNALRQTIRQLGGTIGMAVIGTLFLHREINRLRHYFKEHPITQNLDPALFENILYSTSPEAEFSKLPLATADAIKVNYIEAYISAFQLINLFSACLALIGLAIAFFLLAHKPQSLNPEL